MVAAYRTAVPSPPAALGWSSARYSLDRNLRLTQVTKQPPLASSSIKHGPALKWIGLTGTHWVTRTHRLWEWRPTLFFHVHSKSSHSNPWRHLLWEVHLKGCIRKSVFEDRDPMTIFLVFVLLCLTECALWRKTRADHKRLAVFISQAKLIVPSSVHHSLETWQPSHVYTARFSKWI